MTRGAIIQKFFDIDPIEDDAGYDEEISHFKEEEENHERKSVFLIIYPGGKSNTLINKLNRAC